jgi:poly-gamma-glutamate capsule biosynthesis protein CapA/YwtB (metallophosphatase superfamily)
MSYDSEKGDITIALTGDSMLSRSLSNYKEERYLSLVKIIKEADATFTNLETTVHRWDEGYPGISQGTFMTTEPSLLEELKWMGINLFSCANNHIFDYGESGLIATIKHLEEAGLVLAGAGRNLAEARAPAYLDTSRGRVALIAATATFPSWSQAGEQRPDMRGRPGINPLSFSTTYGLDPKSFSDLKDIHDKIGFDVAKERKRRHFFSAKEIPFDDERKLSFLGTRFVLSEGASVSTQVNRWDAEQNLKSIREARRQADWVVMSLHCHEFGGKGLLTSKIRTQLEESADFVPAFAHEAIDAGTDLVVAHGPHVPLGVEIYKRKPIFYSVGNFIFQNETVRFFPAGAYERFDLDAKATPADFLDVRTDGDTKGHPGDPLYWENIVAICRFRGRCLDEIRLHPIEQGHGKPRAQRGRPVLADEEIGERIIQRLQRLSRRYGTEIIRQDGVDIIKVR